MPNTLALMAVQRQTAASRSAKPSMRVQHGVLGGVPTTRCTKSLSKSAQTPSFRVSLGHLPFEGLWWWAGVEGFGGVGVDVGGHGTLLELTNVKKRMLRRRKMATLEAIDGEIGFVVSVCFGLEGW